MVPKGVIRSGKLIFASGPMIISLVLVLLTCIWLFVVHVLTTITTTIVPNGNKDATGV